MFSYTQHSVNADVEFHPNATYIIIPFGHRCTSAIACKMAGLRKCSLPFDWINSGYPAKLHHAIKDDFRHYIPDEYQDNQEAVMNKYDILLAHVNKNRDNGVAEYERRIQRFRDIIGNNTAKYFVCIYEDYLYNAMHREKDYHQDVFQGILEFEKYYKATYGTNFNILWFDFVKHDIPEDSNIILYVITPDQLYHDFDGSSYGAFREFCGMTLQKIFNTTFSAYLDETMFTD